MLQTIKDCIHSFPNNDFGSYYQQFICETQDQIIDMNVADIESRFSSLDNVIDVISEINKLTEELKL